MKLFYLVALFFLFTSASFAETKIPIGLFSENQLEQWENKNFSGDTHYTLIKLKQTTVLKAESQASASGLFKEQQIDLDKTPFLHWQWRIEKKLDPLNEQSKAGDDYSARLYIVVNGGWTFWKTLAINYVWSSQADKGRVWDNAFAGKNAIMVALRTSTDKTNTWYHEKRNIKQDLKQHFGKEFHSIDAIAIMTDTDNAKGSALSYYGDIYFSDQ